jgi:hypothetical protein
VDFVWGHFGSPVVLETDPCVKGLGAVLSQLTNWILWRALQVVLYCQLRRTTAKLNWRLWLLSGVFRSIQHFRAYLYGHEVTVITDHSALRVVLETPNPNGEHARWWLKVFGCRVCRVDIVYRPGTEND